MSHWHKGHQDGYAIEQGETLDFNPEHITDPGYRDGFAQGRAKAIAERVARGGSERMENEALEDLFDEKMGQIRKLLVVHTNDGLIGQVADILTAAMNAAYRMDRQ